MKKKVLIGFLTGFIVLFQFCSTTKTNAVSTVPTVTYTADISRAMQANCTPCHFPPKGRKKALDSYESVKSEIDEIIERIKKSPGEEGFMPLKHPKLADSTINLFIQWKKEGMTEN